MARFLRHLALPLMLMAGVATATPGGAAAQALHYTTVSTFEMGGVLGSLVSAFSDADEPTEEQVWVGDGAMRTDADGETTIIRMGEGRMIQVDHDARTWFAMDFGDMSAMAARARGDAMAAGGDGRASGDDAMPDSVAMPEFQGEFDVERTGRSETINGYDAEQVVFTLTMEAREQQTEQQEAESPLAGRMVLLSEMWISEELSQHPAFLEMNEDAMEFARTQFEAGPGLGPVGADPRMSGALERMEEELGELNGMAVRTTSLFVLLPGELEFDRAAALESLGQELSGDGPSLADAAGAGAMDAARSALGGLFGRRDEPEEPEEPELAQLPVMRMVQEIRTIETVPVEPGLFEPPADYREVESPLSRIGSGNGPGNGQGNR